MQEADTAVFARRAPSVNSRICCSALPHAISHRVSTRVTNSKNLKALFPNLTAASEQSSSGLLRQCLFKGPSRAVQSFHATFGSAGRFGSSTAITGEIWQAAQIPACC